MRRRTAQSPITKRRRSDVLQESQTQKSKEPKRRRVQSLPTHFVGHPLFGFFVFLALFPGWALVSHCRHLCAVGDFPGCSHNNPSPFLIRFSEKFLPNWRPDGRCGSNFPAPSGHLFAVCNPFAREHCCSQWGYCGTGAEYCAQAVRSPFNLTGTGDNMHVRVYAIISCSALHVAHTLCRVVCMWVTCMGEKAVMACSFPKVQG